MVSQKRREDRRIQRTRQMLQQAFMEVMREKGETPRSLRETERRFTTISIQEITERANVNRGTFYLHFTDKYMLVDTVVREQIHQQLAIVLPSERQWNKNILLSLIRTVLNIFEGKYHHKHQKSLVLAPMIEQAMHDELTMVLLMWLKEGNVRENYRSEQLETMARAFSWTIFGTALQWSQEETTVSLEQIIDSISKVVMEGLIYFTPDTLSENNHL